MIIIKTAIATLNTGSEPALNCSYVEIIAFGIPATILAKISIEIPLPIPNSVIFSPSHIKNTVPTVIIKVVINIKRNADSEIKACPVSVLILLIHTDKAKD